MMIGIDPGLSGAWAIIRPSGVSVFDVPTIIVKKGNKLKREYDVKELVELFRGSIQRESYHEEVEVVVGLELVHSMKGQGVSSTFHFGKGYGIWIGLLGAMDLDPQFITPQKWKKHFGLIGKPKDEARVLAQKMFPKIDLSKKKFIGRADALLIAAYVKDAHL